MSGEAYEIVRYAPHQAEAVARLRAILTPANDPAEAAAALDWKYHRNPYLPEPLIYLALHEGEPVAMRGFFGACWEIAGERRIIPCAADLVVAPGHRDRGVIAKIMRFAENDLAARGFSHIFGLSGGPITTMSALALGYKRVASVDERFRRVPLSALRRDTEPFARFDRARRRNDPDPAGRRPAEPRLDAMAALVQRLDHGHGIRHLRDTAYLAWRYQNPVAAFRFLYSGEARLDGYLVLAAQKGQPDMPVYVLDWEGESVAVKYGLLKTAATLVKPWPLAIWSFGYGAEDRKTIAACGFAAPKLTGVRGLGMSVLVKPLAETPGPDPVLDPARWDYRMLYSDYC